MLYSQLTSGTEFSNLEIKFARLLQQVLDLSGANDPELSQYVREVSSHHNVCLSAAHHPLSSERDCQHPDEAQVMQQFHFTEKELVWTSMDSVKLTNQCRKINNQPPLDVHGLPAEWNNAELYPSPRDRVRWELMRSRAGGPSWD